jgi:hypothetical protein
MGVSRRRAAGLTGLVLLVAGLVACGSGDDSALEELLTSTTVEASPTSGPATSAPTSTSAPSTTSTTSIASTSTSTSTPAPTTTTVPTEGARPEGSGCTPGTADTLPDGRWYVSVDEARPAELRVDVACWFSGEQAALAATEDGEESPPPNDYYVRNQNPALRTLPVAPGATVRWYPELGDPTTEVTTPYADWLAARTGGGFLGLWITTVGGAVTAVEEQWVP